MHNFREKFSAGNEFDFYNDILFCVVVSVKAVVSWSGNSDQCFLNILNGERTSD